MDDKRRNSGTGKGLTRRGVLGMTAAGLAARALTPSLMRGQQVAKTGRKIPVLHVTDLFRPHQDPDDHWDLACVYALAVRGDIDLRGILIDFPVSQRNPDTAAVAQMNLIAGTFVPVAVGSSVPMSSRSDTQTSASATDQHGVRMVLDVLRRSSQPVVINILGTCRDVAIVGKRDPDLFAAKCAAIYLNAGTGSPDMSLASRHEYNVNLDRASYAAIFDLSCPVYWMPCFEEMPSSGEWGVREYGTHYQFRQDEILPHLSEMVQNYFAYALGRYTDHNWLGYLKGQRDPALLSKVGSDYRHMWCTAGFLHAAGYAVSRSGKIVPLGERSDPPVFTFDPISVKCDDAGATKWTHDSTATNRFIFHVRDIEKYQPAMTQAMKSLLTALP